MLRGQAFPTKAMKGTSDTSASDSKGVKEAFACSNHFKSVTFNLHIKSSLSEEEVCGNQVVC